MGEIGWFRVATRPLVAPAAAEPDLVRFMGAWLREAPVRVACFLQRTS